MKSYFIYRPGFFAMFPVLSLMASAPTSMAAEPSVAAPVVPHIREPHVTELRPNDPAAERWYIKAASLPAYTTATAHEPMYNEPGLWAGDVAKTRYAQHKWPKGRVLVWANPGKGAENGWDVSYWLEDGKPATEPFDANTDLVLPDFGKLTYYVKLTDGRKYQRSAFRHLTVGSHACVIGHFSVHGNIWIKAGGSTRFSDSAVGDGNTFWRNDNLSGGWDKRGTQLVDHFFFRKLPTASTEFIGIHWSDDNWQVESGTMIVGPDTEIGMGNRTPPVIRKGATLAIMDGAYFTHRTNMDWGDDLTVEGTLQGGLPERPLTRDARLAIGWKSKGIFIDSPKGGNRVSSVGDIGLRLTKDGLIKAYIAPMSNAHLIMNCSHIDPDSREMDIQARAHGMTGDVLVPKLNTLPRVIDMVLDGNVEWTGILLDDIARHGIKIASKPDLSGTAPAFGPNNQGKPSELFTN